MTVTVALGTDTILNYKRLSYTHWHALAEFVDNSTQSFFNNRAALEHVADSDEPPLEVRIVYDKDAPLIRIADNAFGMNEEELDRALKIGLPPAQLSGRSQYGLGMKTAACWLGDKWEIRTKRLGDDHELRVVFDVNKVAAGKIELDVSRVAKPAKLHYTVLEIRDLHAKIAGRTIGKIKSFLRSMYRVDCREGSLGLYWDTELLEWDNDLKFLSNSRGAPYKREFEFQVDGKTVRGMIGILGEGSSGRPNAGFSLFRHNRVVRGHPDAWRPEEIFGQLQGSNDLINQRITGEVFLDPRFEVSHTKDDILWQGDEEEKVQAKLKEFAVDYLQIARTPRKATVGDVRGPSAVEVTTAVSELEAEMSSSQFVDSIELTDVPPPSTINEVESPILAAARSHPPSMRVEIGGVVCVLLISEEDSPNDPYFVNESSEHDVLVVVNRLHPHWSQLVGAENVLNFLRHCVYDAIAEWKCARQNAPLEPRTIKMLKDRLLRLPLQIENAGPG